MAPSQPMADVEATLAEMWSEILSVRIGSHDRFVDFIDSFAAVEYVNRLRDKFDVDISPMALFQELPSVAALAKFIAARRSETHP